MAKSEDRYDERRLARNGEKLTPKARLREIRYLDSLPGTDMIGLDVYIDYLEGQNV